MIPLIVNCAQRQSCPVSTSPSRGYCAICKLRVAIRADLSAVDWDAAGKDDAAATLQPGEATLCDERVNEEWSDSWRRVIRAATIRTAKEGRILILPELFLRQALLQQQR